MSSLNIFKMRFRNISLVLGFAATFLMVFFSDPDLSPGLSLFFGANTLLTLKTVVALSLACLVIHLSRKTLFDYLDLKKYFVKALETSAGAGLALIAVSGFMVSLAIVYAVISIKI